MKFPEIRAIAASALAATTMLFAAVPSALAHWGHLGELAGHGHLAGLALGAVAAVMAAALVVKGRDEADRDEEAADPASGADGDRDGEPADA